MGAGGHAAMLVLAAGFCLATGRDAPEPNERARQPLKSLEAYGDVDKTCLEWSDGCASCIRRENGTPGCSTPGIACQPAGLTCRRSDATDTGLGAPDAPR